MNLGERLGTRLVAFITLVPAFIALAFFLEGTGWYWLIIAILYPPLALALGIALFGRDERKGRNDAPEQRIDADAKDR